MSITLYLAIPCYNEEEVLPETAEREIFSPSEGRDHHCGKPRLFH